MYYTWSIVAVPVAKGNELVLKKSSFYFHDFLDCLQSILFETLEDYPENCRICKVLEISDSPNQYPLFCLVQWLN